MSRGLAPAPAPVPGPRPRPRPGPGKTEVAPAPAGASCFYRGLCRGLPYFAFFEKGDQYNLSYIWRSKICSSRLLVTTKNKTTFTHIIRNAEFASGKLDPSFVLVGLNNPLADRSRNTRSELKLNYNLQTRTYSEILE